MDSYRESSMSRDGRDDSENASPLQIAAEAANALRFGARGLVRGLSGGHRRQELSTWGGLTGAAAAAAAAAASLLLLMLLLRPRRCFTPPLLLLRRPTATPATTTSN